MFFLIGKNKHELEKIASENLFNLSRSEFDITTRYLGLEKLLFFKPDLVTKEIHFDFYFSIEELLKSIETSVREVISNHLKYIITGKGKSWLSSSGRLYRCARKLIISPLRYLPPPFYRRVKERIRYICVDMQVLQDDRIRLEQIRRALFNKSYIISGTPIPYYNAVDFHEMFMHYLNRRFTDNFIQAVLVDMNVLKISYKASTIRDTVRPIAQEKKIAQVRKSLFFHMNIRAQRLANEKKHDFIRELQIRGVDEQTGKRAIDDLAALLNQHPYEEAKEKVLEREYVRKLPDKLLSDRYEIGPKGILSKKR